LGEFAAAVLITMMIVNGNQQSRESQLELERDRARADAARAAGQPAPPPSQPQVVVVPPAQSQPTTVPVPVPVPAAPSTSSAPAVSDTSIELDITTKLLDDQELRTQPIDVKFSGGTATLSGSVPSDEIKTRAEKVAKGVKGVRRVVNDLTVSNQ
jgi:cell division septation protein DedD